MPARTLTPAPVARRTPRWEARWGTGSVVVIEQFTDTQADAREYVSDLADEHRMAVALHRVGVETPVWVVTPANAKRSRKPANEPKPARTPRVKRDGTLSTDAAVSLVIDASGNRSPSFVARETGLPLSTVRHAMRRLAQAA